MRLLTLSAVLVFGLVSPRPAASDDYSFDDPMFRRCINFMLGAPRGAGLSNICLDEYDLPSPALFLCPRKVRTGFTSSTDLEACAIVFEEEVKRVRSGFVRKAASH